MGSDTACNAGTAGCANNMSAACETSAASATSPWACSLCYSCTSRRQFVNNGPGQVLMACPQATAAEQTACFEAIACSNVGLIVSTSRCTIAGVEGACPACPPSSSKKGLLGLLGLLALIPLL